MDADGNAQEKGLLDEFESSQCFELYLANHVQWRCVGENEEETDTVTVSKGGWLGEMKQKSTEERKSTHRIIIKFAFSTNISGSTKS